MAHLINFFQLSFYFLFIYEIKKLNCFLRLNWTTYLTRFVSIWNCCCITCIKWLSTSETLENERELIVWITSKMKVLIPSETTFMMVLRKTAAMTLITMFNNQSIKIFPRILTSIPLNCVTLKSCKYTWKSKRSINISAWNVAESTKTSVQPEDEIKGINHAHLIGRWIIENWTYQRVPNPWLMHCNHSRTVDKEIKKYVKLR